MIMRYCSELWQKVKIGIAGNYDAMESNANIDA